MANISADELRVRFSKGDLGVSSKATSWQPAPWAWVKKKFGPDRLRIKVRPAKGGDWLKELNQEFTGLDARAAENYARRLIEEGTSDAVWVDKEVYLDGYYRNRERHEWMVAESQRFELAFVERNPMPKDTLFNIQKKAGSCSRCKAPFPVPPPTGTTGYAIHGKKKVCFTCAAEIEREFMRRQGKSVLYLSEKNHKLHVTTWTGEVISDNVWLISKRKTPQSYVSSEWVTVRFTFDGAEWTGQGSGVGMYLRVRRLKGSKKKVAANPYYSGVRIAGNPAKISVYETGGVWFASHPTLGTIRFGQVGSLYPPRTWVEAKKYASARWGKDPWPIEYLPGIVGNPDKFFAGKVAANPLSKKKVAKSLAASGRATFSKRVGIHKLKVEPSDGSGYEWAVWRTLPQGGAEIRRGGWVPSLPRKGNSRAFKEAKRAGLKALQECRVDKRSLDKKLAETDYRAKHANPAKKKPKGKKLPYKPVLAPKGGRWAWIRVYPRSLKKAPAFRRTLDDAGITGVQLRTTAYGAKDEIVSVRARDKHCVKEALYWFRKHDLGVPRNAEKHIFVLPKK